MVQKCTIDIISSFDWYKKNSLSKCEGSNRFWSFGYLGVYCLVRHQLFFCNSLQYLNKIVEQGFKQNQTFQEVLDDIVKRIFTITHVEVSLHLYKALPRFIQILPYNSWGGLCREHFPWIIEKILFQMSKCSWNSIILSNSLLWRYRWIIFNWWFSID